MRKPRRADQKDSLRRRLERTGSGRRGRPLPDGAVSGSPARGAAERDAEGRRGHDVSPSSSSLSLSLFTRRMLFTRSIGDMCRAGASDGGRICVGVVDGPGSAAHRTEVTHSAIVSRQCAATDETTRAGGWRRR
jgi:hypothetical protein